jgi:hypothetical protein
MNEILSKAQALVDSKNTDKNAWTEVIHLAQAHPNGWDACAAVVRMAGTGVCQEVIKGLALEWYGGKAAKGDLEATLLLRNYALMANDGQLLAKFETKTPPPIPGDNTPRPASEILSKETIEQLGLSPNDRLAHLSTHKRPVTIYNP